MWQIALDAYAAEAEIAKVGGGAREGGRDSTASCATCRRHTLFVVLAGEGGGAEGAAAGGHVELDEWTWTSFPLCLSRGGHRPQSRGYVRQQTKKWRKPEKVKVFSPSSSFTFSSLSLSLSLSAAVPYLASGGGAAASFEIH